MAKITRRKRKDNYTVVSNDILQDSNLSWAAKGMLIYLLHLPDNWQINVADLSNRSKNGRDGTAGIIKELITVGYISRVKIKNEKNQFKGYDYTVNDEPVNDEPVNDEPVNGKAVNGVSVNGKAVASKYYTNQELSIQRTNEEQKIKIELPDQIEQTKVEVHDIVKPPRNKYIQPPTLKQIIPIFLEKLIEKGKSHPQILDNWNHANHQAEKFWLHWDEKNWKVQKLNGAIATWINQSISYGVVLKDCPVKYPGNPQQQKTAPIKQLIPVLQLSKEEINERRDIFEYVNQILNQ